MLDEELFRVGLFLAAVGTVFGVCAATLGGMLAAAARGLPVPRPDRIRRVFLGLGAIGAACVSYGRFVEPFWPEVVKVRLETPKLPPGSGPFRLVLLSDLHCDPAPRLENRLPYIVAGLKPHAIVFAGDALNAPEGAKIFKELMKKLSSLAPTYAVWGNWDAYYRPDIDRYEGTGVKLLGNGPVRVEGGGAGIWLVGVNFGKEQDLEKNLRQAPANELRALIYHLPDLIPDGMHQGADLYLAGHTHGGQVALPFYGALVTLSRFGKRFEAGLYKEGPTWIYVNRGIGMEGGHAPRVRFCARPEVTLLELRPVTK